MALARTDAQLGCDVVAQSVWDDLVNTSFRPGYLVSRPCQMDLDAYLVCSTAVLCWKQWAIGSEIRYRVLAQHRVRLEGKDDKVYFMARTRVTYHGTASRLVCVF